MLVVALATPCMAQEVKEWPRVLEITSPANLEIVRPGQAVTVTVESKVPAKVDALIFEGAGPIGINLEGRPLPAQIPIVIPEGTKPGPRSLVAWGKTDSGERVTSTHILIDVEPSDMPKVIAERVFPELTFDARGNMISLCILATFPDGRLVEVTESTYMTYATSDARVATVNKYAQVTSGDAGTASIAAVYRKGRESVRTTIPVTVSGAGFAVSPAELTFRTQAVGTSSTPQYFTVTNRREHPLEIIAIETGAEDFVATSECGQVVMPRATCRIAVVFQPTEPGERPGGLRLYNQSTSADIMPLSGIGVRPIR